MVGIDKDKVNNLKAQWTNLWQERYSDKIRAEGVATSDFQELYIDKGTIICATRDCKEPNFKEILQKHNIANCDRYLPPDPYLGGWGLFIRKTIRESGKVEKRKLPNIPPKIENVKKQKQQPKKKGKGWLHAN